MSWTEALRQNRRNVMSLTRPDMSRIFGVLSEARDRTAKSLAEFIRKEGSSAYQLQTHRALLAQLDDTLSLVAKDLPKSVEKTLTEGMKSATKMSVKSTENLAKEGIKKFSGEVAHLRIPVANVLTKVERTLIGRYETQSSKYAGSVGNRIRRELAIGVVRGESVEQIARRFVGEKKFERLKNKPAKLAEAIADRDLFRNEADAVRLVRTELVNAYTEAELESIHTLNDDDPGWMKKWDAANDLRVCILCAELDEVVVGPYENFRGGVKGPPLHPNDRCCIIPVRNEW